MTKHSMIWPAVLGLLSALGCGTQSQPQPSAAINAERELDGGRTDVADHAAPTADSMLHESNADYSFEPVNPALEAANQSVEAAGEMVRSAAGAVRAREEQIKQQQQATRASFEEAASNFKNSLRRSAEDLREAADDLRDPE